MAVKEKIRIRLKSYDASLIDSAAEKIVETAKRTGARVSGPVPLPTDKEVITILRAVHKYKDSREQFENRTHKRLIDILKPSNKTVEALTSLQLPAGVDIENVGDILKADVFAVGDRIDVVGTSKGKGYAGAIKRWNQHRLRESHGTGPVARHAGSMGSCSTPSRVFKGKRLPGHLGAERVTIQNLKVVKVDAENNLIAIKGAIPGPKGSVVCISDSVKA